jgi:hypothetical protein
MWSQVATNKSVGALFPNDADGNAWGDTTIGFPQASGIAATGSSPALTMPTKTKAAAAFQLREYRYSVVAGTRNHRYRHSLMVAI